MTETTGDNRHEPLDRKRTDREPIDGERVDPLDRIGAELDDLAELDPAEAVTVLADITAELSRELDADTDRS